MIEAAESASVTAADDVSLGAPARRTWSIVGLLALSLASLGLLTTVDDVALLFLDSGAAAGSRFGPALVWLIDARVTSCMACAVLYVTTRHLARDEPRGRAVNWRHVIVLALLWVFGTVMSVFVIGVYVPALPRSVDIAAFIGFGLLAEELLFRGALFALAARTFPTRRGMPIVWTAALFSAQHLQFYHYHVSAHALVQLGYSFPMGLVLGYIRSASRRVWPAVATHVATNAVTVLHGIITS